MMRYQIFNSRDANSRPVLSAPWYWLAFTFGNLFSMKWGCCRIFDSKTGDTPMEWVRANYRAGQEPIGGHKPITSESRRKKNG